MKKPVIVIITGESGSGKTTLGNKIAAACQLPLISKDAFKELLFDELGWSDREWSKKVGKTSFALIDYVVDQQLQHGKSVIVETNFKPQYDSKRFRDFQQKYGAACVQVLCRAEGKVLYERFVQRAHTSRHPGHVDAHNLDEFRDAMLYGTYEPLDVDGPLITVDTTDFTQLDEPAIIAQVQQAVQQAASS